MNPMRHRSTDTSLEQIFELIRESFAFMDGRIDPPSSMHRLRLADVAAQCETGEVWSLGKPPIACVFLTAKPVCLYVGKIAVAEDQRGQGLCRKLIDVCQDRAKDMGLEWLELETRIELVENHTAFGRLGFEKTAETAHPGYDRATSVTMRKRVL